MALLDIFWPNIAQRYIHLVPGTVSPRIDQLLWIDDSVENRPASNPPAGVKVTFTPGFRGAPNAHGVEVNTTTGQVTAKKLPEPPAPLLRNFIIDCTATQGAATFTQMIRVHIHPAIRRHWVTPSRGRARKCPAPGRRPVCLTAHEPHTMLPLGEKGRLKFLFPMSWDRHARARPGPGR